jgi:phenylalanyl-tRNA synthetase alpha chain
MDIQGVVKNLHPLEVKIILSYKKGDELSIERVEKDLGFKPGNGNQALSWLLGKGIVRELRREQAVFYELTELGRGWQEKGSPEERILELVRIQPGLRMPEIAANLKLDNKDIGSAYGALSKLGLFAMDDHKGVILALPPAAASAYWAFFSQKNVLGFLFSFLTLIPLAISSVLSFTASTSSGKR